MNAATNATTARDKEGIVTRDERNKYGQPTGHAFHRCTECGREVMTNWGRDHINHAADCPNVTEADR